MEVRLGNLIKIKATIKGVNIEFEGSEEFLENKLLSVLEQIAALGPTSGFTISSGGGGGTSTGVQHGVVSTATLASLVGAKKGGDLLRAAAAHLSLMKVKATMSRLELLEEMRGASTYYKDSYASNLTNYFDTLIKAKQLNQQGKDTYAQSAAERHHWEKLIESHNSPTQALAS